MKYLIQNRHWNIIEDYNLEKLLYLLIDRPDYVSGLNEYCWKNNKKQFHRNYDLPSSMWINGLLEWRTNGCLLNIIL